MCFGCKQADKHMHISFSPYIMKPARLHNIPIAYLCTLMPMRACEGSCRMCPLTTMSKSKAPSESRPLTMWVILRISPANTQSRHISLHINSCSKISCLRVEPMKSYLWQTPPASPA